MHVKRTLKRYFTSNLFTFSLSCTHYTAQYVQDFKKEAKDKKLTISGRVSLDLF